MAYKYEVTVQDVTAGVSVHAVPTRLTGAFVLDDRINFLRRSSPRRWRLLDYSWTPIYYYTTAL